MKSKLLNMGVGIGIILFALIGLLPGSFLGGIMGLNITAILFGSPVQATVLSRIIIAMSMIMGVMTSGFVFIFGCGILGYLIGTIIESIHAKIPVEVLAKK